MADTMTDTKVWEIINPSDQYTIVGEFEPVACAVLLLGEGAYGLSPVGHESEDKLPLFLLGGFDEWAAERWPTEDFADVLKRLNGEIVTALRSVLIGDRSLFEKAGMDREAWHDHHRTSMNDIGSRAQWLAERFARPPGGPDV